MSDERRRLVSIITPTWQRPDLLYHAIDNVREQTYRPIEHVVIHDGLEPGPWAGFAGHDVDLINVALGRNWSSFLPESFCAAPLVVGQLVASGDYQTWLADDEVMRPDHVETLVDALERDDADFAYSRVEMFRAESPDQRWIIGSDPPALGQITNCLYRVELLKHGLYPFGAGKTSDWACISRWQSHGARHAFVERVTLSHRADH